MFWALRLIAAVAAVYVSLAWSDDVVCAVINACLFLLPLLLLVSVTGRWMLSLTIASVTSLITYALGEAKYFYLGERLAVADYALVAEPANWLIITRYPMLYGSLALLLVATAILFVRIDDRVASKRARVASMLSFVGLCLFCVASRRAHAWEVWKDDADCKSGQCGVMARLVYSTSVFEYEPSSHAGDPSLFRARMQALPPAAASKTQNADIVVWLNESTLDPRSYKLPGAQLPGLKMMDAAEDTRARGPLRVHTFGGKTWLAEFSLLTGLVPDDFGARRNLAFNTVAPRTTTNLVRVLKARGYKTIVLMPSYKRLYGAGRAYLGTGFDEVLTLRDFSEYDALPGDEWDIAESPLLAEAAQKIIERHRAASDAPLFLYLLSIKEHAPYLSSTPIEFGLERALPQSLAAKLTDYVLKLKLLDESVQALYRGLFTQPKRPTVFAWFGDHQAFFEEPSPPYAFDLPKPDHVTQFQLRTSFAAPSAASRPLMDIAFLPSLLLDYAGVEKDRYFESLSAMRQLCLGLMDECADKELITSYKAHVFSADMSLLQ